jgi:hypothetical protein
MSEQVIPNAPCFVAYLNFFKNIDEFDVADFLQDCKNFTFKNDRYTFSKRISISVESTECDDDDDKDDTRVTVKIGYNSFDLWFYTQCNDDDYAPKGVYLEEVDGENVSPAYVSPAYTDTPRKALDGTFFFNYYEGGIIYKFSYVSEDLNNLNNLSLIFKLEISTRPYSIDNGNIIYRSKKYTQDPQISITSRLLVDESDIGHTIFNIKNNSIISTIEKDCPKIVSVLKGSGCDMWNKLSNLVNTDPPETSGQDFLVRIVYYSMLKYILGYLLYGKFSKKYILNKYHKQLLKDLKNSQYNNYLPFFTTSKYKDYNRYFLYEFK